MSQHANGRVVTDHPFLISLFPVAAVFAANIQEVPASRSGRPPILILQADQGRAFGFNGEEPDLLNRTLSVPG